MHDTVSLLTFWRFLGVPVSLIVPVSANIEPSPLENENVKNAVSVNSRESISLCDKDSLVESRTNLVYSIYISFNIILFNVLICLMFEMDRRRRVDHSFYIRATL